MGQKTASFTLSGYKTTSSKKKITTLAAGVYPVRVTYTLNGSLSFNMADQQTRYVIFRFGNTANPYAVGTVPISRSIPGQLNNVSITLKILSDGTGLKAKDVYFWIESSSGETVSFSGSVSIHIDTVKSGEYYVDAQSAVSGGGTARVAGDTIVFSHGQTVQLAFSPYKGYELTQCIVDPGTLVIEDDYTFVMPEANVSIQPEFNLKDYSITTAVSPAGAGTVTVQATANYRDTVTVQQTANNGYVFDSWTLDSGDTVTGGEFTMPAQDVVLTAGYRKMTHARMSSDTLKGGTSAQFMLDHGDGITRETYIISFGTGMETEEREISQGVAGVSFVVPATWAAQIPNDTSKTGGTLTIRSYEGTTYIGSYVISGLTYQIPDGLEPTISFQLTPESSTTGYSTYFSGMYVQGHAGVRAAVTGTPKSSATIASIRVRLPQYTGADYDKTVTGQASAAITTGLLTIVMTTTVEITVTDSRGLSATQTQQITVTGYTAPQITSLRAWRVNTAGQEADMGEAGMYTFTYAWTQIGQNELHWTLALTRNGTTIASAADCQTTGWILDGTNPEVLNISNYYDLTLTMTDRLETRSLTYRIDSAKCVMNFTQDGNSIAFGHVVRESPESSNYDGTFEIDEGMEIHIGWNNTKGYLTLKEYIQGVINGTV